MFKATLGKEIVVKTTNEMGILHSVSKTIAEKGIAVLALSCWVYDIMAIIHVVTEDNLRAKDALDAHGFESYEDSVVMVDVPHKPGMLNQMTERLKKLGLDLRHLYATAKSSDKSCLVVFSSSDDAKAIVELNK